jgi:opacity protein-like surface antigen
MIAVVLGAALSVQAADADVPFRIGGNVIIGLPVGEFRDNVDHIGSGLSGYVTVGVLDLPVHVGGSVGYMTQGSENIGEIRLGPYIADMITRNNVLLGHLLLRVQGTGAGVRPYFDALVGAKRLYTTTEIRVGFNVPDIDMDRDDWAISYGLGGGLSFEVYESTGREATGKRDYRVRVDVGALYLMGGKADYVDIDSVELINERIWFNTISSRTDLVTINIGASVLF